MISLIGSAIIFGIGFKVFWKSWVSEAQFWIIMLIPSIVTSSFWLITVKKRIDKLLLLMINFPNYFIIYTIVAVLNLKIWVSDFDITGIME